MAKGYTDLTQHISGLNLRIQLSRKCLSGQNDDISQPKMLKVDLRLSTGRADQKHGWISLSLLLCVSTFQQRPWHRSAALQL